MDFKKFGNIVFILGLIIFAYGGFQYLSNQPEAPSGNTMLDRLRTQDTNMKRTVKRRSATDIMIGGGIVAFVGIGISYSAKDEEENEGQAASN